MKKIFFAAFVLTLGLSSCNNQPAATTPTTETATTQTTSTSAADYAYIQVEAILAQSDLYLNEGVALQEKTQKAQKSWAQKEQRLQADAASLQEKYQKGLITTVDAQAQERSIAQRANSFQTTTQKEAQALEEENFVFTNRAQDLLMRAVQEVNTDKKYKMIFNASALIDADTTLNITTQVLEKVNALYAAEKKETK